MLLNILEVIAWIVLMGRFIYLERENKILKEMCASYNAFVKDVQKVLEQDDDTPHEDKE